MSAQSKETQYLDSPCMLGDTSNKKARKIRKTLDLICFDSCVIEEKNTRSVARKKGKALLKEPNYINVGIDIKPQKELKNASNCDYENDQKENINNNEKERKIVKAKRLLRNHPERNFKDSGESSEISFSPKNHELVITTLPSPISPSASNIEIIPNFHSSQENLCPSTEGSVETSKRHTFEIETSTIDVSILKSVSEQDSERINSMESEKNPVECKTPQAPTYSKVTMRRKWDKFDSPKPIMDSPSWVTRVEKTQTPFTAEKITIPKTKTSSSKKFSSKVKVPNFAAIHQKALAKMESIDEYKVRKENRAKMLLSGRKPEVLETSTKKESRKQLRFAFNTVDTEKSPTFIPLPSTPLPKRVLNISVESPKNPKAAIPFLWNPSKIPKVDFCKSKEVKTPKFEKSVAPRPFNFQNNGILNKVSVFKKQEIKIVAKKTKPEKNTLEARRCTIKGVRSNRRFELLMNMRKGK